MMDKVGSAPPTEEKKKSIYYHEKPFVINQNLGRESINRSLKGEEQKEGGRIPKHKKFMLFNVKGFSLTHFELDQ